MFIEAKYFGLSADYTRAGRDRKVTEGIARTELADRGKHPSHPSERAITDLSVHVLDSPALAEAPEPRRFEPLR
jgi:hypothetical protein